VAFVVSVGFTALALAVFGFLKGRALGARTGRSAVETVAVGGLAAAAAYALARLVS
jgi:VIT1/CCC1 family predicted Fe2+/Mn2+ transporter